MSVTELVRMDENASGNSSLLALIFARLANPMTTGTKKAVDAVLLIGEHGRYPLNESVNMARINFDLGIVHYASDTPYTQARTLGARGLSYRGLDSTYAAAIALARRILQREGALNS